MSHQCKRCLRILTAFVCWFVITPQPTSRGQSEEEAANSSQGWDSPWVTALARVPDSSDVVAASAQGLLLRPAQVVQVVNGDFAGPEVLYEHPTSVWAVAVTGGQVFSTDYRGSLGVLDRQTKEVKFYEQVFERWTRALTTTPDGQSIVAGNEVGKLSVWNMAKAEIVQSAQVGQQQVYDVEFAPDGTRIAACDGAGHVHVLAWPELTVVHDVAVGEAAIWDLAFLTDGVTIVAGGSDQTLWRINIGAAEPVVSEVSKTSDWIATLEVSSDGKKVLLGQLNGAIRQCDLESGHVTDVGRLASGIWDMVLTSADEVLLASRKNAVAKLGRTWTVVFEGIAGGEDGADE